MNRLPQAGRPRLPDVVDCNEMWMVQRRGGTGFLNEALQAVRIADEGVGEDLQRHLTAKLAVVRAVHFAHTAAAEQRSEAIAAYGRASERASGRCHEVWQYVSRCTRCARALLELGAWQLARED